MNRLVEAVIAEMGRPSDEAIDKRLANPHACDIRVRAHGRRPAFDPGNYPWLAAIVQAAMGNVLAAIKVLGEHAVMRYLRFFGLIMCPDPDRHPAVIRHCLWPLIEGPLKTWLADTAADQIRGWLRANYPLDLPSEG